MDGKKTRQLVDILNAPSYFYDDQKVALGKIVPFLDQYYNYTGHEATQVWRVTHSSKILQQIGPAHAPPYDVELPSYTERKS